MAATTTEENSSGIVVGAEKSVAMIMLISSDGVHFEVTETVAGMSQTLAHMIEDGCVENSVPLPNVKSAILAKVIEYCNKHVVFVETDSSGNDSSSSGATTGEAADLKSFDADFVKMDQPTLFEIILAVNYLNIKAADVHVDYI